jgi:uncharacterized membrane protein YjdF
MSLSRNQWAVLLFSLAYILPFSAYYISIKDFEFLWYIAVLLFFLLLIIFTVNKTKFTPVILWGLSIWGLLHMAGGGIPVGDSVLYAYKLIDIAGNGEFSILKYDQFVHAFGFGVTTLVAHHLMAPRWANGSSRALLYVFAALVGMGLGSVNEIVEFIAVATFPETGVGGYFNTALDIVFNALGATAAALFLAWRDHS